MTKAKAPHEFRSRAPRRTPEQMALARASTPAPAQFVGVVPDIGAGEVGTVGLQTLPAPAQVVSTQMPDVSADILQQMRVRARERKLREAQQETARAATAVAPVQRWIYNSNTENISEFPEGFLIVEDGYFEYTPPLSFPYRSEDKDVHLEFCRSRVNTKPIDGIANAKAIRAHSEQVIAQVQYLPPQPQVMDRGVLTLESDV